MKQKKALTVFLAGACAFALAHAQPAAPNASGVQIYGRLDASVNVVRIDALGTNRTLTSDTSILGFRGTEQLGGGLVAYFKMEHGLQVDTGANSSPTTYFNRESYVGLGSPSYGYVELGAHWGPAIWLTGRVDPFGRVHMGANETLLQGAASRGYNAVMPNSIEYITPNWAGFRGRVVYQLGEGAPARTRALALDYVKDRLYVGMLYDNAEVTGATVGVPVLPAVRSKTMAIGATYRFDAVRLSGYVQNNRADRLANAKGYFLGAVVPFGRGEFKASYVKTDNPGAEASQLAVGYDYIFSPRTLVYTTVARLNNEGAARFGLWPASQDLGAAGRPAAGRDVTGVQIGVRHSF